MTEGEIARAVVRDPCLLLAVGPSESHGNGLPVGTGAFIAEAVVDEVSRRTGILRARPFPYGVTHPGADDAAGVTSLRRKTLHRAVNELLAGWEDDGIEEFVLVTAHSSEPHLDALLMVLTPRSRTTVFDLGSVPMDDVLGASPGADLPHLDASILLHLQPDRIPEGAEGASYAPDAASGEAAFERYVDALVRHLGPRSHGPRTVE